MQIHVLMLLPFSYSNVSEPPSSGQMFLVHRRQPSHGNLWISSPVSVSHQLRRHFTSGRSHYPGRPALGAKLAKHFPGEPGQIEGGIEISVDDQPTDQTLIGAMFERHAFLDVPTAGTAFGRGKPTGGNEEISASVGHL